METSSPGQSTAEQLIKNYEALLRQSPPQPASTEHLWDNRTLVTFGLGILVFGLIVLALMCFLLYKKRSPEVILRTFSIPLIIIAALFLITVGWSKDQMAPVIGLFGTIAGYILGRTDTELARNREEREGKEEKGKKGDLEEIPK